VSQAPSIKTVADPIGETTLRIMSEAARYNRWIGQLIQPYLGTRILEVGAGIANMTQLLLPGKYVVASDPDPAYLAVLREAMRAHPNVAVRSLKLPRVAPAWATEKLDTAVLLNILEHVEEDVESLENLGKILAPPARVVIFVPAIPRLYGSLDRALGHYRRYSSEELRDKIQQAGLVLEHLRYCNFVGMFGWWFYSRVARRKILPAFQVRIFDRLVPILARFERRWEPFRGQSLLAVARRAA
jgi:SAM-dependent methyltransferase